MRKFYQVDITDREDNIWTGPVIYGSHQEAEFHTMLELQSDWGDGYMPDEFIATFGPADRIERVEAIDFPGDEMWDVLGFWDQLDVNTFMLNLDPVTALAKLGKIECTLSDAAIEAVMAGEYRLRLTPVKETVDAV